MSDEYTIQDIMAKIPEWGLACDDDDPDGEPVRLEDDEIVLDAILLIRTKKMDSLGTSRTGAYTYTTQGCDLETLIGMLQRTLWEQQAQLFASDTE